MLERIIDHGLRPEVPKLDLSELSLSTPSRFNKAAATRDDLEDFGKGATEPTTKSSTNKDTKAFTMSSDGEENPLYHVEMIVFETELKKLTNIRMDKVHLIKTQLEHFYQILWNQCGLSMQRFIQNIKAWKVKHQEKDSVWLYLALQSVGVGTVAVNTAQAMSSTLRLFSGMLKSANTDIHVYHLRWTQAYDAAVASGNSELSELQKIYMFTDSLDDANYSAFKDTVHNDDVKGTPLSDTF